MIKTWAIAILVVALALTGSLHFNLSQAYQSTINKYDVVLSDLMDVVAVQDEALMIYKINENILLEEVGGLTDALEYVMDETALLIERCDPSVIEDRLVELEDTL